ncbi:MAG: hypothetical protein K9N47_28120 [Prosthecobacter sp.]|uniref:hypothetical protein n=1 Tax=Prosthecobacter sp. TaxID=1965333 RepID=UPI00262EF6A0|nr:hypothetical protein [Prosthecobacter sp.]MCF7790019.1 hypothetical protein [Prosthecobacter sp.]
MSAMLGVGERARKMAWWGGCARTEFGREGGVKAVVNFKNQKSIVHQSLIAHAHDRLWAEGLTIVEQSIFDF